MLTLDPFSAGFLSSLAANLATQLLNGAGKRTRELFSASTQQQALERCSRAGIIAIVTAASAVEKDQAGHLAEIFGKFFKEPEVGKELVPLLRGQPLQRAELFYLFKEAGYDAQTLRDLDFGQALNAFEAGFLTAALQEPEIREIIKAGEMLKQSHFQSEQLKVMEKLIAFLQQAHLETLSIQAGLLIALRERDGVQVKFELPALAPGLLSADWESHYLRTLISQCEGLDLTPIDETVSTLPGAEAISVSDVFTTLYLANYRRQPSQTVADAILRRDEADQMAVASGKARSRSQTRLRDQQEAEKEIPIAAVEAVAALPRLMILGQPGGGKSTLVNHIAAQLAHRRLGKNGGNDKLPGWLADEMPLPVRIVLRRFSAWLQKAQARPEAGVVWDYLKRHLHECGCDDAFPGLQQQLRDQGGVIFFDGLDEVPAGDEETKRTLITRSIGAFARPLDKCRVVITCREYAYRRGDEDWHLPEASFPAVELDLFKEPQIESFITTWYKITGPKKGWGPDKCTDEARNLTVAVKNWPHLKELAQYPLLLTLMAQVHGRDGYLPNDRADLYDRAVNLLLVHWENRIVRDTRGGLKVEPGLVMQLGIRTEILRNALERVAHSAHERQERETNRSERAADLPREELREELSKTLGSLDRAETVITYIQERAGLLQARDNRVYTFPHRTFQEYLAAKYIMRQSEFDILLRERVRRDLDWWHEVFLLAAGSVRSTTPRNICDLIEALVPQNPDPEAPPKVNIDHILLASQTLHETEFVGNVSKTPGEEPDRYTRVFTCVQNWLQQLMQASLPIPAGSRARAGDALAQLTDPRVGVTTLDHIEFCWVPGGDFLMGSDESNDEQPLHLNEDLSHDYWISRFPITVAQYQLFVNTTGHQPSNSHCLKDPANRPVRQVIWEEAVKFCRWLTEHWHKQNLLSTQWHILLPSEAEWVKAARGGIQVPEKPLVCSIRELTKAPRPMLIGNDNPLRRYPWGDTEDANHANYNNTKIGHTNPVGCFVGGQSPYGCEEMSGNAREWTRSLWGEHWNTCQFPYPYNSTDGREKHDMIGFQYIVCRGGSFVNSSKWVRSSCRLRAKAHNTLGRGAIGFRIILCQSR